MSHCDPDTLALRSLGEGVGTPEDEAHLAACQECQLEVANLSTLVSVARSGGPLQVQQPSPDVWDSIRAELGLSAATSTHSADATTSTQTRTDDPSAAPVVSLSERRARRSRPATWLLAAAGIGGIVVGGAITATVIESSGEAPLTVAASVDLDPLPAWDASGTAELAVDEGGQQVLVVSLDAAAVADSSGYQEVWLIDENVEGMVSLGVMEGSNGQFVIPTGVDVTAYPIVDVSLEPFDGDPTHSGDSIARGQIQA